MKNVNVFVFIVMLVQAYLLFSNLIKLIFRPWHLLIHKFLATMEVSFEYNAEKPCYVLTFLANLEENGTGIRHEVGLTALGIDGNIDFRYYYLVTLGKGAAINDSAAPIYMNLTFALSLMDEIPTNKASMSDNAQKQSASNAVPISYSIFQIRLFLSRQATS